MADAALKSTGAATDWPRRKVLVGGVSGAVSCVLMYVLNHYVLTGPEALPADVGAAITTMISFGMAWLVPPSDDETTTTDTAVRQPAGNQQPTH